MFTADRRTPQAAVTVARRVAEEQGTEIGRGVGYAVRFEERSSPATRIKYLTGELSCYLKVPACLPLPAVLGAYAQAMASGA